MLAETVARLENQHIFAPYFAGRNAGAFFPRVASRHHHLERFVIEWAGDDARQVERQSDDGCIHGPVLEVVGEQGCHALLDVEMHFRCDALERGDQVRQQIGADSVDHPQSEFSMKRV